jgi:leucyl aminopeptidase
VGSVATLDGTGSSDPDGDPLSYSWRQLAGPPVEIVEPRSQKASVELRTPGRYVFELSVSDGPAFVSRDEVAVTATGAHAVFDPVLRAPRCALVSDSCDSVELILGRDQIGRVYGVGSEPNQPNTLRGSCADGSAGRFHADESLDRIKLSTLDGQSFAPGESVRIEATVWAWAGGPAADRLDLYYAADATRPSWKHVATLTPVAGGTQVLSASYRLPAGRLQAVRARFRYQGSPAPCGSGPFDDHDDLVFAVRSGPLP